MFFDQRCPGSRSVGVPHDVLRHFVPRDIEHHVIVARIAKHLIEQGQVLIRRRHETAQSRVSPDYGRTRTGSEDGKQIVVVRRSFAWTHPRNIAMQDCHEADFRDRGEDPVQGGITAGSPCGQRPSTTRTPCGC